MEKVILLYGFEGLVVFSGVFENEFFINVGYYFK